MSRPSVWCSPRFPRQTGTEDQHNRDRTRKEVEVVETQRAPIRPSGVSTRCELIGEETTDLVEPLDQVRQ